MTSLAANQSALADQACELVDDMVRACPAHRAGTRPMAAARPVPAARRSWRQKVLEQLRLDTPFPTVAPGEVSNEPGVFDYAARHPEACPAAVFLGAKFVPESYTTCCYHAVHAFAISAPDGTRRWARFHWEPVDGVRSASPEACRLPGPGERFLRDGLKDQIVNGRAEFVLRMVLAEEGEGPTAPTRPWSQRRPRVVMGHLRLTDVPDDQWHGGELLSFNPTRLVPGIGLSADPTLNIRGEVYRVSSARRLQTAHLPPASSNPVQT